MAKTIALILARGGSKSIPLKNLKSIAGQPLIFWAIQELIEIPLLDEIWVSTDSDEISIAVKNVKNDKVHVFRRDAMSALDTSSSEEAILEFLREKSLFEETILFVQATSPFTLSRHFEGGLAQFETENLDSLLSVVETKTVFLE